MTTKTIDKSGKSKRLAASRRSSGRDVKSPRIGATPAAVAQVREESGEQSFDRQRMTKHAVFLRLLNRADGTTIPEMMQAAGWQQHSVRGFLAGTVKKKLGLALTSSKVEGEPRRYRIAPPRRGR